MALLLCIGEYVSFRVYIFSCETLECVKYDARNVWKDDFR